MFALGSAALICLVSLTLVLILTLMADHPELEEENGPAYEEAD